MEGLEEAEATNGRPFLKLKVRAQEDVSARTYNYWPPFKMEGKEAEAHIKETKAGLKLYIDEDITFRYEEKDAPGREFPFKNVKEFLTKFNSAKKPKKKDDAIAETHMANVEKEKEARREKRIAHMAECLEDAREAWAILVGTNELTGSDMENIRAIAISFAIEDNRRGF